MGNLESSGSSESQEQIQFRLNQNNEQLGNNEIKSTSYTALTFIPLNILHQFTNLPNIYFAIICILQMIPSISVTGGKPTTALPLSFVLITVLFKDMYEQYMRYKKDKQQNERAVTVVGPGGIQRQNWQNLHCGDIIILKQNQLVPCDAIILSSTSQDNKCFIETKSLDGETNLKVRKGIQIKGRQRLLHTIKDSDLGSKKYKVTCQQPNKTLQVIRGSIDVGGQIVPISIENVILRGCIIRNCRQVKCAALYVGSKTKVMLNSAQFTGKKSKLMSEIDKMTLSIFVAQILLSLVLSLFNILIENNKQKFVQLFQSTKYWINVASWWLLMTYFVPISLIVSMQMIKLLQGNVIEKDRKGFSTQYNCYISANNTSINQNLGQIKYVFTDKTGTLTKNQMNFKKLIVNGYQYGDVEDVSLAQIQKNFPKYEHVSFRDSRFFKNINDQNITNYLRAVYLCHDVLVSKRANGEGYSYDSSSPDEIALINFAKMCGFQLMEEEGNFVRIFDRQRNQILKYQKLAYLQFNSQRKRMSVIVRLPNGQIQILTKGADSIVEKRLKQQKQQVLKNTKRYMQNFSIEGLRTLLLAHRIIPESQFNVWNKEYLAAKSLIQGREQKLSSLYDKIQERLQLLGGSGVQDKLQEDVSNTIVMMKNAGIKFFVLTGDKKQTAVSIGRSSGLISPTSKIFSFPQQKQQAESYLGQKVYLIDASDDIKEYPSDIFKAMVSYQIICYRCTPIQKKNIVNYVRQHTNDLTLAIGDGANDVNMILAADVGVGVKGKQGTEATRVADIAVGQFKFLSLITLYYGRQWYRKNTHLVCFNFWKNWYHVAAVIVYGAYSYFSAVVIFDIYNYELFNALYAALPIVIYAIFDEQYDWEDSKKYPDIYQPGLKNQYFNKIVYLKNIGIGSLYGILSIIIVFMVLEDTILDSQGRMGYMWQSGAVLFSNIVMVVNFKVLVMSYRYNIGLLVSVFGSIILYWIVYWIQAKTFANFKLKDSLWEEWSTLGIYLIHIILVFMFIGVQFWYRKYTKFSEIQTRIIAKKSSLKVVKSLLL